MGLFLSETALITKVKDYSGAGTTDITSDSVDMEGFAGVIFITSFGTGAANNYMHAEQSADDSSFANLEGSQIVVAGSETDQYLDIRVQGNDRYIRVIAEPNTSSTVESIWAIQYLADSIPQTNITVGTQHGLALLAPAEGTP